MLDRCLERFSETHEILITFANTGREKEETLEFVDAADRHFCQPRGHRVVWLEAIIHHGERKAPTAKVVTFETANRDGKVFESAIAKHGIFNKSYPNCTGRLKDEPIHWWLRSQGWERGSYDTAIGIRADEILSRASKNMKERRFVYPLADEGWRKRDVNAYMAKFPWDLKLAGDHHGNCDGCWKKSLRKLMTRAKEDPSVFDWWGQMERKYGMVSNGDNQTEPRTFFRQNKSAQDIVKLAFTTDFAPYVDDQFNQPELFDDLLDLGSSCGESCEVGADDDYHQQTEEG
jgi:3'-phosphoadenosine 5'-phosphosulfate sulfotransferase (PAPS reductase)/FAD synthetase